jgi:2'-5' RNA ligase
MESTVLYMFAIMPPQSLSSEINDRRVDFFKKYKFTTALKPPVHITLFDPIEIAADEAPEFERRMDFLQRWAERQRRFQIRLQNYNFFSNPRRPVVYIDVLKNLHLKQLQARFLDELKKYTGIARRRAAYKPHVTIAYRDVEPEAFPAIKEDYNQQNFQASFECNTFFLWRHNRNNWQIVKEFRLNGKEEQLSLF